MMMNDIIRRAKDLIDELLERNSDKGKYKGDVHLSAVCNDLKVLRETSLDHEWTPLFLRQLARLMDCNKLLSRAFWLEIHDDISYFLGKLHSEQNHRYWTRFRARMKLEGELMQRELQFKETYGERKSLHQLCQEHGNFLFCYLENCITLHGKIQVYNLIENIDEFLRHNYQQKDISLTHLQNEFKSIQIDFSCSNTSLEVLESPRVSVIRSSNIVNNTPTDFLPSVNQLNFERSKEKTMITVLLKSKRWLMILGDPGNGKTTLLRWIMHVYAKKARQHIEHVSLEEEDETDLLRIPILIRIDEFAKWLEQHRDMTLFDYIGQHTWFSQLYHDNNDGNALKEFIIHGHALILLDGLDEISDMGRKGEIVQVIQEFLNKYTCTSHFLSPFDKALYKDEEPYKSYGSVNEIQPANIAVGNQVIATSRIVGYQLHPLNGSFIVHSLLLPLSNEEADQFVKNCIKHVEQSISDILSKNNIQFRNETNDAYKIKRNDTLKIVFHKKTKLSTLNSSLLSMICMSIFTLSEEFHPKCRLQVYHHAIQLIIRMWNNKKSNISENVFIDFLTDLAAYLHIQSPSGLIDEFDMKRLCSLTFKQYNKSIDRTKLRQFTNELTSLLGSNVGIVAERGLQVFGFLHLSFQEYFVARALVEHASENDIIERFLGFAINPRFREPLLLTLGWISCYWSHEKFDKFCGILLEKNSSDYIIPLGALLFFDAFDDMQTLPSDDIIFTALNILLDHPSYHMFTNHCLTGLSKLSEQTKLKWIHLHLINEKRFCNFCRYLLAEEVICLHLCIYLPKILSPIISKQLWLISCKNTSTEFIFNQTFRRILTKNKPFDNIIRNTLSTLFISCHISSTNIHPLILSVIIVLYGGLVQIDMEDFSMIQFSPYRMHRQSLTLFPIIQYFTNTRDSHSIKVQMLIKQYTNYLRQSSSENTSVDVVDTFVALICVRGLSQPLDYQEFDGYQALPLALNKFKLNLWHIKRYDFMSRFKTSKLFILSEIESIISMFCSQQNLSDKQRIRFSLACAATWKKLGIDCLPDALNVEVFQNHNLECQPEFNHLIKERKINQMSEGVHPLQLIQNTPYFLLTFVPQSLQLLYYHLIIAPIDQADSLSLAVLLTQCLIFLEHTVIDDSDYLLTLSILESLFREYKLGRYASILFWRNRSTSKRNTCAAQDQYLPEDWDRFITEVKQLTDEQNDVQRFTTSISLAGLYRAQHQSTEDNNSLLLSANKSEEIYSIIISIIDPVLRILTTNIILNMKDPSVFDKKQRDKMKWEMIRSLKNCFPCIPLLTATLLFIECHGICETFVNDFQEITKEIITKLNDTSIDKQSQDAAYIALNSMNIFDLSYSLVEFEKRTTNLSDLLQFNSTIFYHYIADKTSFGASNRLLLTFMYLAELTVDVQILKMYSKQTPKKTVWLLKDLYRLWDDSSKSRKIITLEVATWITNYLQLSDRKLIQSIITDISACRHVEKKTYPVIKKWLDYQTDKDLNFFAYYAACLSIQQGENSSLLIDMMNNFTNKSNIKNIVQNLLELDGVDSTFILKNLADVIRTANRWSLWPISRPFGSAGVTVTSATILELILNLEHERIVSNVNNLSKSFLFMIDDCSLNVQNYLAEYFYTFLQSSYVSSLTEDIYLAMIMQWLIVIVSSYHTSENFSKSLYECIFLFLEDQRFSQVQKTIVYAFRAVFENDSSFENRIFTNDHVVITLEKIICSSTTTTDVLNACLLAYGKRLLKSKTLKMNQIVSDEMQNVLETLFRTSSSDCISARAQLCLIFSKKSLIIFRMITDWLTTLPDLTPEKRYHILLQQSLYEKDRVLDENPGKEVLRLIQTYSDELLDKFIVDLYEFVLNITNKNRLLNPEPDYLHIATEFVLVNSVMFCNGVQKKIGEEKFQTALYKANKHEPNALFINLYASFGVITSELIDMLACLGDGIAYFDDSVFENLRQVSGRDVIENLFYHLKSSFKPRAAMYSSLFKLAFQLARNNIISPLEMHQCASSIMKNNTENLGGGLSIGGDVRDPFGSLVSLTCIEKDSIWPCSVEFISESDIDERLERDIRYLNDKSILCLRKNYFLASFD